MKLFMQIHINNETKKKSIHLNKFWQFDKNTSLNFNFISFVRAFFTQLKIIIRDNFFAKYYERHIKVDNTSMIISSIVSSF